MIPLRDDPVFWRYGLPARTVWGWAAFGFLFALHFCAASWLVMAWHHRGGFVASGGTYYFHTVVVAAGVTGILTLLLHRFLPREAQLEEWALTGIGRAEIARAARLRTVLAFGAQWVVWLVAAVVIMVGDMLANWDMKWLCAMQGWFPVFFGMVALAGVLQVQTLRVPPPLLILYLVGAWGVRVLALFLSMSGAEDLFEKFGLRRYDRDRYEFLMTAFLSAMAMADVAWQFAAFRHRFFRPLDAAAWRTQAPEPPRADQRSAARGRIASYVIAALLLAGPLLLQNVAPIRQDWPVGFAPATPAGFGDWTQGPDSEMVDPRPGMLMVGYLLVMMFMPMVTGWLAPPPAPWSGCLMLMASSFQSLAAPLAVCAVVSFAAWGGIFLYNRTGQDILVLAGCALLGIEAAVLVWLAMLPRRGRASTIVVVTALGIALVWFTHRYDYHPWQLQGYPVYLPHASKLATFLVFASGVALWLGIPMLAHRAERSTVPP